MSLPPGLFDGLFVNDVVVVGGEPWFLGNFNDSTSQATTLGSTIYGGLQAGAFLMRESGAVSHVSRPCDDTGTDPTLVDEAFYVAGARVDHSSFGDLIAIAGGVQGGSLHLLPSAADVSCPATPDPLLDGPGNTGATAPSLLWFDASDGSLRESLFPDPMRPGTSEHGYLSDVAALPGTTIGEVVALGIAQINPFGSTVSFESSVNFEFYVMRTAGLPGEPTLRRLMVQSCVEDPNGTLDGLRSSVAASGPSGSPEIWVGVTACDFNQGVSPDRGVLFHLQGDLSDASSRRVLGDATNPVSITEIAVVESPPRLIVAGTYSGDPDGFGPSVIVPTGQNGDGFIAAFDGTAYTDQSSALWFQRIDSNVPMTLDALTIADGAVFVGGRGGSSVSVGDLVNCVDSETPDGGRSVIVALDLESGAPRWLRADGARPTNNPEPLTDAFARTSALGVTGGSLYASTSSIRKLLFECSEGATPGGNQRRFDVRTFTLR
jgi:hypothetical protein